MGYTPPSSDQLPFIFTEGGYEAPTGELLFRFGIGQNLGNLSAAIQVMQLYHDETYTYVKSCPKYIIGYRNGSVQIMKGPCIFGGIRDLWSNITGIEILSQTSDLSGFIKVMKFDMYDLSGLIKVMRFGTYDLSANIAVHLPKDINYSIKPVHKVVLDFSGSIYGWQQLDLYANILIHPPKDLEASIFVKRTFHADLDIAIHAWHIKDLQARLDRVFPFDLLATIDLIRPVDLTAYLKVRYTVDLKSSLKGWCIKNLSATINSIFDSDLNIKIHGRDDMFGDLYFRVKGLAIDVQNLLGATVRGLIGKDLNATLIATYLSNLSGYLFPVCPKDISVNIYGWDVSDLQAILNGQRGPWDLLASIFPNENLRTFSATIYPKAGTNIFSNLPINIHSWEIKNLTANIGLITAGNLRATLIPYMCAKNLRVSIYPKMIRLSTVIDVATMEHKNLSAMINTFCVFTGYKNLSVSLYTTYKSDLFAYIKVLKYIYKPKSLNASIGYTDTITEVDKYKISFNILESEMRTFDRYMIGFDTFGAVKYLSAYIKGTLRNVSLGATIIAKEMIPYSFGRIEATERVVHLTYAGVFKTFETVEMAFKSLVHDYYYSTAGNYAWKANRLDRWILELKSYLPRNIILKLRRRLHKEVDLYDLRRFSTIDEAMRYAIAYITEYPQSDLNININGKGRYASLGAIISPRYVKDENSYLSGILTPVKYTIIVSTEQGDVVKL
jgi:hypothetical protein